MKTLSEFFILALALFLLYWYRSAAYYRASAGEQEQKRSLPEVSVSREAAKESRPS